MTQYQHTLSRKYILYKIFSNMFFIEAVWLYFYRLFISDQQVGLLDGLAFGIGLLAEVPSGALADKFGHAKIVKLGQFLAGSGFLIQAIGGSFLPLFVGQTVLMIGISLTSGADEALFFEKFNFPRSSVEWRKLVTRGSQMALIGSIVATISGGWLHALNPRIPWVLSGISFLLAVIVISSIQDVRSKLSRKSLSLELQDYGDDITKGFTAFRLPTLWLYVPLIVTVQGLFYTVGWGLLRLILLDRFSFNPFWGSIVLASSSLATVAMLWYMHRNAEKLSEKRVLTYISVSAIGSLLLSVTPIGLWGYFVILTLYVGEFTLQPFMSEILNNHAPDKQRATVLSVASFLRTLPYIVLAPLIGYLNTQNDLEYFLVGWSILMFLSLLFYLKYKKRDEEVRIREEETLYSADERT